MLESWWYQISNFVHISFLWFLNFYSWKLVSILVLVKKKKKIMFEDIIFLINIFNYNIVSNRIIISNFNLFSCLISKSFICNLFLYMLKNTYQFKENSLWTKLYKYKLSYFYELFKYFVFLHIFHIYFQITLIISKDVLYSKYSLSIYTPNLELCYYKFIAILLQENYIYKTLSIENY